MSLNLYTYKPPANTICNDDDHTPVGDTKFFIQGVLESLHDSSKSKSACFLELKREQNILLKNLNNDLLNRICGNYYKSHVLLNVLSLYNMYLEEFADDDNAFNIEVMAMCRENVICLFELFSCATNVVVFLKSNVCENNKTIKTLNTLQDMGFVTLIKTVQI